MGLLAVRFSFIAAGILTLITCMLIPAAANGKLPKKPGDFLILPENFGAKPEDSYETSMRTEADVMKASVMVREIFGKEGRDPKTSNRLSLFVEEMGMNVIKHGFVNSKKGSLDLRIIFQEGSYVVRLRDDGKPFKPLDWLEKNKSERHLRGGEATKRKYLKSKGKSAPT